MLVVAAAVVAHEDGVVTWQSLAFPNGTGPGALAASGATSATLASASAFGEAFWLFGGIRAGPSWSSELWSFSFHSSTWTMSSAGGGPQALEGSAMASVGSKLYVFGGSDATRVASDQLFSFDTGPSGAWTNIVNLNTPMARSYHSLVALDTSQKLLLFGGVDASLQLLGDLHEVEVLNPVWASVSATGSAPAARKGHSMTASSSRHVYLFGGEGASGLLNEAHQLLTDTYEWSSLQTAGEIPLGRKGHAAVILDRRLFIFGGTGPSGNLNDLSSLNLDSLRWSSPRALGGAPGGRWGPAAASIASDLVVYGGVGTGQEMLGDMWRMSRECQGQLELTAAHETFSFGGALYLGTTNCSWRLRPSRANQQVQLLFSDFALQAGADSVHVYEGGTGTLLRELTGLGLPEPVVSSSGSLLVTFQSGAANSGEGFDANFRSLCTAGYVQEANAEQCTACAAGTVAASAGSAACEPCDVHSYQDETGQSACEACPGYSEAADPGASALADCNCVPGYYRTDGNTWECEPCPEGATCLGGASAPSARRGWCQKGGDSFAVCCEMGDCPAGNDACPDDTAAAGEYACSTTRLLTMTVLAFSLTLTVLCVLSCVCAFGGYTYGLRKGNRDASALGHTEPARLIPPMPALLSLRTLPRRTVGEMLTRIQEDGEEGTLKELTRVRVEDMTRAHTSSWVLSPVRSRARVGNNNRNSPTTHTSTTENDGLQVVNLDS